MPGRKWYFIAFLVFVIGAAAGAATAYVRLSGLTRELPQIVVPGEAELNFSRPGTYTIYLERESVVEGRIYSTSDEIAGLRVRLTSPSGAPIDLTPPSISSNYTLAGRSGVGVLSCTIAKPGRYHVAAAYPDGRREPQGVLAIGLDVPARIVAAILIPLAIGLTGFLLAVAITAVTFWRRRRITGSRGDAPPSDAGPA
jgi:hypothetical protein